jgi:hypothetical protein
MSEGQRTEGQKISLRLPYPFETPTFLSMNSKFRSVHLIGWFREGSLQMARRAFCGSPRRGGFDKRISMC